MTERVSTRELLALAIPSAAFVVLTNGYRLVDQYFIQGVSTAAQAAIGSSIFVLLLFFAGAELVAAGVGPLVARATGAGDLDLRRRLIGAGFFAATLVAVVIALVGGLGADLIAAALGLEGDTARECASYLAALSLTMLPFALTPALDQAFVSMGSARAPLVLHALSLALNVILTPLFIFDLGLSTAGAALAANLTRGIATAIGVVVIARSTGLRWSDVRPAGQLGRIFRVGAPMALGTVAYSLVYWAMLKTSISPLGPHVNAALGIGFSALEGFTWPCFHGVSLAVASLVGRALGAKRPDLAIDAVRRGFPVVSALGVAATLAFWLGGRPLTALFTEDPLVHQAAIGYAVALAASQLFVSWEALFEGVLAGAGDTRTVFWLSVPFNVLRIPLAWWLAFPLGFGAVGVWWAINLTSYAKTLAKAWATRRGRWVDVKI